MTTIYLIRHSVKFERSEFDKFLADDDKNLKDEKTILSVVGEKRAEILCSKSIFDNVDVIFASNMARTIGTAKYLSTRLNKKINIDRRFNERRYGTQSSSEYKDWYERQYLISDFKTIGGESQEEVRNRMLDGLYDVLDNYKNKTVAIFSHGYAITFMLLKWCKLIEVDKQRKLKFEFNNKIVLDKVINSPEVFKLTFEDKELKDIEIIEFDDLPYMNAGI